MTPSPFKEHAWVLIKLCLIYWCQLSSESLLLMFINLLVSTRWRKAAQLTCVAPAADVLRLGLYLLGSETACRLPRPGDASTRREHGYRFEF